MSMPNVGVKVVDHAEHDLTAAQLEELHRAEWTRELATLDEQIEKLTRKVKQLKADTSLKDTEAALAEVREARDELKRRGPV